MLLRTISRGSTATRRGGRSGCSMVHLKRSDLTLTVPVERFVAIGETAGQAERNLDRPAPAK